VTIVMFADFQCPYCKRAAQSLAELRKKRGRQVRLVFKHHPLPHHPHAERAAQFSMHARAAQGDRGFWRAQAKLFDSARSLEDEDLARLAAELGLDPRRALRAVHRREYARSIEADQQLAQSLKATGTPTFFINGRRFVGARSLSAFEGIVDEELAHARELRAQGVPPHRIYKAIQKGAKTP